MRRKHGTFRLIAARFEAYTGRAMSEIWRHGDEDLHSPEDDLPRFLTGHFLISSVHLVDPNFYRTVVLLVQHGTDGAFGLVVNRSSERTLSSVLPDVGDGVDIPLYIGGPVQQDYLFILHGGLPPKVQSEAAASPAPGVFFEPATKGLIAYFAEDWISLSKKEKPKLRMFAGYSGWGPGQLEREIREHSWFILRAREDLVFQSDPEGIWRDALSKKGKYYRFVAETGSMPSVN